MSNVVNILLVDELPIIRFALRSILSNQPQYCIVGEASSITEATAIVKEKNPDIITTELMFSNNNHLRLSDLSTKPGISVLAFTTHDSWDKVESFVQAGGTGFVSKKSPVSEVKSAIDALAAGRSWISPRLRSVQIQTKSIEPKTVLSKREKEIVILVAKGLTSKQIADQLCLSARTVENHRHRIFKRLGIKRSAQLVRYALKNKLLNTGEVSIQ